MNFSIEREQLLQALQLVMGVIEKRQAMPILSHALLSIEHNRLTVMATDLEVGIASCSLLEGNNEEVHITVPARKLVDIARALSDRSLVEFTIQENKVILKSGKSRFTLLTLPATEFPVVEEAVNLVEFSLPQKDLRYLIEKAYFSMAQQDVRYYLNGVLLEINSGHVRVVASDGHRLSMSTIPSIGDFTPVEIIIPRKGIIELLRLLGQEDSVTVCIGNNHIQVKGDTFTFTSKLIEGRYPEYNKILPKTVSKQIMVDRDIFKRALSRVAVLSNEKFHGVKLLLRPGSLLIQTNNIEHEQAQDEIEIEYQGEELDIGFNITYFLDVFNVLPPGLVRISFSDSNSSAFVETPEDKQCVYVIMPMRL